MVKFYIWDEDLVDQLRLEEALLSLLKAGGWDYEGVEIYSQKHKLLRGLSGQLYHQVFFLELVSRGKFSEGLEFAKEIRKRCPHSTIVFVSRHLELLSITFDYKIEALDVIDKNSSDEVYTQKISSVLEHVFSQLQLLDNQFYYCMRQGKKLLRFPFRDILFFETSPNVHRVVLHTPFETIEFYGNLKQVLESDRRLYRVHRSYVVNPHRVERVDRQKLQAWFENGQSCPISRKELANFSKLMEEQFRAK